MLRPETQTVAKVGAEKTVVVASMFFPDVLFLATGGITSLRPETCEPLKDKRVILFPDLGAEDNWREKACIAASVSISDVKNRQTSDMSSE